ARRPPRPTRFPYTTLFRSGSSARFHPDLAVRPIADSAEGGKPLAAFVVPAAPEALRLLRTAGVSAFRTPEACADSIAAAFYRREIGRAHVCTPVTFRSRMP